VSEVAYLGVAGSYSHTAAIEYFTNPPDEGYEFLGHKNFRAIFNRLSETDDPSVQGIVPIENTLAGSIYDNYDLLDANDVHVIGEHYLKISHLLLGTPAFDRAKLEEPGDAIKVYSHPKALEQCSEFLAARPWLEPQVFGDTATAAQFVSELDDVRSLSISSPAAGELYCLTTVAENIANNPENYTRFLALGKEAIPPENANKCSLIIQMPFVRGSLNAVVGEIFESGCSIPKIESRPLAGKPFEYLFYFDIKYGESPHSLPEILERISAKTIETKLLGAYSVRNITPAV
jgi:chorismate mutase/prephenate dehydratase